MVYFWIAMCWISSVGIPYIKTNIQEKDCLNKKETRLMGGLFGKDVRIKCEVINER